MTSKRTAIILGGSGSVGTALLRELFQDDGFHAVITLSRRSLPEAVAMARTAALLTNTASSKSQHKAPLHLRLEDRERAASRAG